MRRKKSPDDQWLEFLAKNYRYDPTTGTVWKSVGCVDASGYTRLATKSGERVINVQVHNLAIFLMTGRWPENPVDHINRIRHDNRWENLRECSYSDNGFNKATRPSKSGFRGVSKDHNKYYAKIQCKGVTHRRGGFDTPEEASEAYKAMAMELYGMTV